VRGRGAGKALASGQGGANPGCHGCNAEPRHMPEPGENSPRHQPLLQASFLRHAGAVKVEIDQAVREPSGIETGLHVIPHSDIATASLAVFIPVRMRQAPAFGFEGALISP
jgi:hypothetical protein